MACMLDTVSSGDTRYCFLKTYLSMCSCSRGGRASSESRLSFLAAWHKVRASFYEHMSHMDIFLVHKRPLKPYQNISTDLTMTSINIPSGDAQRIRSCPCKRSYPASQNFTIHRTPSSDQGPKARPQRHPRSQLH